MRRPMLAPRREEYEALKAEAMRSRSKRSRMLLHRRGDVLTQMVICLHKDSYIQPHRHPAFKDEVYHVMEGTLHVSFYGTTGMLTSAAMLDPVDRPIMRIPGMVYHEPHAVTEWVIYHEIYVGPFNKYVDVEYAPWAEKEAA